MISGFLRQEALALAGITSNFLNYLERCGLVSPERIGNNRRPVVLFTWQQVLILAMIREMREDASLQSLQAAAKFLSEQDVSCHLSENLLAIGDSVIWSGSTWEGLKSLIPHTPFRCTLTIFPPLSSILPDIEQRAKDSRAVDYEGFRARLPVAIAL
ncbi:MAG TPA: MerR family transcriptional regulator [Trichocoleus sp.]